MTETTVTSIADYFECVNSLAQPGNWLYRGQTDAGWDLIPSAFRGVEKLDPPYTEDDAEWITQIERDVYRAFDNDSKHLHDHRNQWELLCLAQHYGTPTRLLDWTRSSIIAGYFAVIESAQCPAAVWCFNIDNYPFPKDILGRFTSNYIHRITLLDDIAKTRPPSFFQMVSKRFNIPAKGTRSVPLLPNPIDNLDEGFLAVLDPPKIDGRISAQQGVFTIHYSFDDYDLVWDLTSHLSDIERDTGRVLLHKIVFPETQRNTIRDDLQRVENCSWYRLYPDLFGLSKKLTFDRKNNFQEHEGYR